MLSHDKRSVDAVRRARYQKQQRPYREKRNLDRYRRPQRDRRRSR